MAVRTRLLDAAEPVRSLPMVAGALLLAVVVAGSTARAGWASGTDALPGLAVYSALVGCALGVSRLRAATALPLALAPAPVAAFVAVSFTPAVGGLGGWPLAVQGWRELVDGRAASDPGVLLFLLYLLFWLLGAWLAWCLLRRRQPLLAAAPAGAALATNVLNFPDGQEPFVFFFIVLTFGLLLWSSYRGSLAAARHRGIELAEGARWDFWERGALAAAGLITVAVLAPPLSATDRTTAIQNGLSDTWGRVTHSAGTAPGGTSVGFSSVAQLGGPLTPGSGVVFTYTIDGEAPGPAYFRGEDLQPLVEEWAYVPDSAATQYVARGQEMILGEAYQAEQRATYIVDMLRPPAVAPNLIVVPGQLATVDRDVEVIQALSQARFPSFRLETADRVTAVNARGVYHVVVEQSVASEDDLRAVPPSYPPWLAAYIGLPRGYRPATTERRIHDLAVDVTSGATNPYDQAVAVESYLRDRYTYTLTPPAPPAGVDPEDYFLFTSHQGYCVYFATAMADMLRSLGLPVRLATGYGPGTYDASQNRWVVEESDAHTWPEVYFRSYGWIPFEPTPDGVYFPIQRGGAGGVTCTGDSCSAAGGASLATPAPTATPRPRRAPDVTGAGGSGRLTLPALRTWTPVAAVLLLALVLLFIAVSRFLRPQTVAGVWRRATLLLQLAGVRPRTGETPIEFGDRVAGEFPETAAGIRQLAGDFAIAAYAPLRLAEERRPAVLAGWGSLRPLLLRRVAARVPAIRGP